MKLPVSTAQAHLVPGYRLDRYELLYAHARGAMATVWAARIQGKHGFAKLVAIKTILPEYAEDAGFRAMFLDEARIAAGIRHPNVAEIDDLGEENGTLYLVIEWIDGESWATLHEAVAARGEPFPTGIMLRIAADALAGLHAAHGLRDLDGNLLNVVHRDVTPHNILVTTTGVTKVIDFGVAKARDRLAQKTKTGLLKGKVEYTAPEQARMQPSDGRVDIWAMGVVLYQLLSGKMPHPGKNDLEILRRITAGKPPERLPSSVPPAVRDVVMKALQPNPDERWATALDMQRAVEAAMPSPVSSSDVESFMHVYLADRIAARKRDLAEALADAAKRPPRAQPVPSPSRREERASFPSYPDAPQEMAPMHTVAVAAQAPAYPSRPPAAPSRPPALASRPPPLPPPPARPPMDSPDPQTVIATPHRPDDDDEPATVMANAPRARGLGQTVKLDPPSFLAHAPAPVAPVAPVAPLAPVAPMVPSTPVPAARSAPVPLASAPPPRAATGHWAAMAGLTVAMLGVWGFVGSIAMRARASPPPVAPATASAPVPTTVATPAVGAATASAPTSAAPIASTAPIASAAPVASAAAASPAPSGSTAPEVSIDALADVSARPVLGGPWPAPVGGLSGPVRPDATKPDGAKPGKDKPDGKKKPAVDDGF